MNIYKDIFIFIVGILVIIKSADFFTAGAEGIAKAFRIPRIIIGLTIVSLATTAPEFTVSVVSSYMKAGGMAVGNAVGSCLANIGLILAIAAVINPLKFNPRIFKREMPFLIFIIFILYFIMMSDNWLDLGDGIILCLFLVGFLISIIVTEIKNSRHQPPENNRADYNLKKDGFRFLTGAAGVVLCARYAIVPGGINIARFLGVPEIVIGLSMVAVGTSLPELFTAIAASSKKMGEIAVGNVIGANILNLLWVLGFASMVNPLRIDAQTKKVTMPVMFLLTLVMFAFSRTKFRVSRPEGLFLAAAYTGYIFYLFKFAY
jgi:cation:H+ antiporter